MTSEPTEPQGYQDGTEPLNEHDFRQMLTRSVELADGEDGWYEATTGDPDDLEYSYPVNVLRTVVTTYEGSQYRVVIIGPLDPHRPTRLRS